MSALFYCAACAGISVGTALHNVSRRAELIGHYPVSNRSVASSIVIVSALWPATFIATALPFFDGFWTGVACALGGILVGSNFAIAAWCGLVGTEGLRDIGRGSVLGFAVMTLTATVAAAFLKTRP